MESSSSLLGLGYFYVILGRMLGCCLHLIIYILLLK
nr:MAG TPA: hypothetical protein [Crassvirales sp.]